VDFRYRRRKSPKRKRRWKSFLLERELFSYLPLHEFNNREECSSVSKRYNKPNSLLRTKQRMVQFETEDEAYLLLLLHLRNNSCQRTQRRGPRGGWGCCYGGDDGEEEQLKGGLVELSRWNIIPLCTSKRVKESCSSPLMRTGGFFG